MGGGVREDEGCEARVQERVVGAGDGVEGYERWEGEMRAEYKEEVRVSEEGGKDSWEGWGWGSASWWKRRRCFLWLLVSDGGFAWRLVGGGR